MRTPNDTLKPRVAHAALVRGEDGNLTIRHFETPSLAAQAARGRDLAPILAKQQVLAMQGIDRRPHWTVGKLAKAIGLTPRAIHLRCDAGQLPCIDHGTTKYSRRMIPAWIVDIALTQGLRAVAARVKAGILIPPTRPTT